MRARFPDAVVALAAAGAIAACDSGGTVLPLPDGSTEGAADATEAALPSAPTAEATAAPPIGFVRLANWSADAPAVDLCLAPHGTKDFQGPLVGALANADVDGGTYDGGGPALISFPQVSAYVAVAPGTYDARLVVAGAASCSAGILPDLTSIPPIKYGGFATLALLGDVNPGEGTSDAGLTLIGLADDAFVGDAGAVGLRFIHAASNSPAVDMGAGTLQGTGFTPLFYDVSYGGVGTRAEALAAAPIGVGVAPVEIDDAGYEAIGAPPLGTVSVHTHARSFGLDEAAGTMLAVGGTVVTLVLVPGPPTDVDSGVPSAQLIECVDNGRILGPLSNCFTLVALH